MVSEVHARTPNTCKTRLTRGGGPLSDTTCPYQWGGEEGHQQVHIFEFCQLFHSLREVSTRPNRCVALSEFETPTLAPLIAPVVTITPLPLLYHIRTLFIARYTSPTTYPSQPIYIYNELQQRKRKRNKGGGKQQNIVMIIITIPKSTTTTNIQIHHFNTTCMCPRFISGVPFDSVGRFWATLLLHTTCMRS